MGFFNKDWTLNKHEVLRYFTDKLDIFSSDELLNDKDKARAYINEVKFRNSMKKAKTKDSHIMFFTKQIMERAKIYTPKQDAEEHNKEHPEEPHLRDAFEIIEIKDAIRKTLCLVNRNSYAAAVHEDAIGRKPAYHKSPTRSHYLLEAAIEVSAEYNDPYDIYIKIGPEEVALLITSGYNGVLEKVEKDFELRGNIIEETYKEITWFPTKSEKVLNRREALAVKKLEEQLKKEGRILDNYIKETEEKNIILQGFKLLIKSEGLSSSKFSELEQAEYEARQRWAHMMTDDEENDIFDNDIEIRDSEGYGLELPDISDLFNKYFE